MAASAPNGARSVGPATRRGAPTRTGLGLAEATGSAGSGRSAPPGARGLATSMLHRVARTTPTTASPMAGGTCRTGGRPPRTGVVGTTAPPAARIAAGLRTRRPVAPTPSRANEGVRRAAGAGPSSPFVATGTARAARRGSLSTVLEAPGRVVSTAPRPRGDLSRARAGSPTGMAALTAAAPVDVATPATVRVAPGSRVGACASPRVPTRGVVVRTTAPVARARGATPSSIPPGGGGARPTLTTVGASTPGRCRTCGAPPSVAPCRAAAPMGLAAGIGPGKGVPEATGGRRRPTSCTRPTTRA